MRFSAYVATGFIIVLSTHAARAAEAPSVDTDSDETDEDLENEAFGPHANLRTRAEQVSFDPRQKSLELSGNVRVDSAPFHLRSSRIRLTRTKYGVEIEGKGSLAFCPCLGTPLTVDFDQAVVAPPGDLVLRHPVLRVYSVPILPLPYFWLRSDEKFGVLPPDLAYRGQDGLYVGEGVHVPWRNGEKRYALELRGGSYLVRGAVADVRLRTPSTFAKIRYDRLASASAPALPMASGGEDDGLLVDARGDVGSEEANVAWDADVLRGRRGVVSTTELDAAAKPWDRASIVGALHAGPIIAETGVRAVTRRGGALDDVEAQGPVTALRASGAASSGIIYDATVEGGALRVTGLSASLGARTPETLSLARIEAGALFATSFGPLAASLGLRGVGDVVAQSRGTGSDEAGTVRASVSLPLVRAYRDADTPTDPWVHVIEPFVEASALHARGDALLGVLPGGALAAFDGNLPLADAGFETKLGRWGMRENLEFRGAGGAAYGSRDTRSKVRPLGRGRAAATLGWFGLSSDAAYVFGDDASTAGGMVVTRARFGPSTGVRLLTNVAVREGIDPMLARIVSDAPLEPPSGFLTQEGTTGGAGVVIPWSRVVTTSFGADGDATRVELVAARAGIELRDRCGCLIVRAAGSERIGRSGLDVWVGIDFVADR